MSVEIHIRRLHRYDDLSAALAGLPDTLNIDAAFIISEIGSLMPAVLRFVGAKTGTVVHSDTEILSLSGALARNESGGSHIRMAVYDQNDAVFGGHLMVWSMVRATAEIVIGSAP
ncbi:MAG: DNA-binding protein [Burkholderiales bacterium]|nr:DNA-binding protein [Burkholderiales bacterium]